MNTQKQQTGEGTAPRVRLTVDVERFPYFIAKKGMTGTVTQHDIGKHGSIYVKLDEPLEGCEEWNNELVWQDGEREHFLQQTESI